MPATALATCEIFGTIYDVFGEPAAGATIGVMAVYKNGALILAKTKEVQTDLDGYFTMDLPRDSVAVLYANTPGLNISCLGSPTAIPDADAAELASIVSDVDIWNEVPVAIPIGAGVASFNGRRGDVVLLASDVTGALGYTPADAAALAGYLLLAGGTMTGTLTLAADPIAALEAASKRYVDNKVAAIPAGGVTSFNARTGAVVAASGDYAAFYAALVHTHTRSQITDLGIFSTSAPGLVPQPTGADAAKVLSGAGTWVAQSAGGSATLPGQWLLTDLHVSGSAQTFTGTIAAGALTTLTLATASDFAVSQGILIMGAGSNAGIGGALWTTVAAIDGTKKIITLAAAATAPVTAAVVKHDDQAAFQAAINYVYNAGGGDLLAPPGWYRLNGPLNSIGSLLTFPFGSATGSVNVTVRIRGTAPVNAPNFWTAPNEITGAVIQTDVVAPTGAIMRCAAYDTQDKVSNITVGLENLTFRTYADPQISAVDLAMASNVFVNQVVIDTGVSMLTGPEPTNPNGIAFRAPRDTVSSTGHAVGTLYVQNYWTGLVFTEQMVCSKAFAMKCKVGLRWDFSYHPAYAHVVIFWCPTSVYYVGRHRSDAFYDIERDLPGTDWWNAPANIKDFYDPTDQACGLTRYCIIQTNSGTPQLPVGNAGCSKMVFSNVSGLGTTIGGRGEMGADPTSALGIATKQYVDAMGTGGATVYPPGGADGDLQMNAAGSFGPSIIHQYGGQDIGVVNTSTAGVSFDVMDSYGNGYIQLSSRWGWFTLYSMDMDGADFNPTSIDIANAGCEIYMGGADLTGTVDDGNWLYLATSDYENRISIQGPRNPVGNPLGVQVLAEGAIFQFQGDGLTLPMDPTLPGHAATKAYVDAHGGSGGGGSVVDVTANYGWSGLHTWSSVGAFLGGLRISPRLGINDAPQNYARIHVISNGISEFAFEFTNNIDASTYFSNAASGSIPNSRNRGRSYFSSYGDLEIGNHTGTPGDLPERRVDFYDIGTLPYKRSMWVHGYPSDANDFFVCSVDGTTALFKVNVNGDVTLAHDPTSALHAATKQYVDSHAGGGGAVSSVFTRTGAVVAASGDYAAFYAALAHTHTRAQITDLGVFSTSQPGLVPQPTGADAAKVLTGAGTWITVGGAGVDVSASYAWTGTHSWSQLATFTGGLSIEANAPLNFSNGSTMVRRISYEPANGVLQLERTNYLLFSGPNSTGLYSSGSVLASSYQWDFSASINMNAGWSLTLGQDPTLALHAATKQYVDAHGVGVTSFNTRSGVVTLTSADVTAALTYTPVASFNTRTGAVTLTSADVTGALTYTPVNKAGDTLTGALTQTSAAGSTAAIQFAEELLALSTSGTTSDTVANLLPTNSIILSVTARVTTTITGATAWQVGDGNVSDRFVVTGSALTAGTTAVGINQWQANRTTAAQGPPQTAAAKVRVTTTGTASAGAVRITVRYMSFTAATS